VHTCDGILVAWRSSCWSVSSASTCAFSVSIRVKHASSNQAWWLTSAYGPSSDGDKPAFLAELHDLEHVRSGHWLLWGDFNIIYREEDKNNDRINRRLMGQFCRLLNEAALKEVHLNGHLFTWSNERAHPTLERIDRPFISM
jgi:hypothetical protein